jgi:hypothetical protein
MSTWLPHAKTRNASAPQRLPAGSPAVLLVLMLLLAGCGTGGGSRAGQGTLEPEWATPASRSAAGATPGPSAVELSLGEQDIKLAPLPIRAGIPFTITATIHNNSPFPAENVPVLVYLSGVQEQIGYTSFLAVVTTTVPATHTASVQVPVVWNLAGGDYRLWVRVNNVPDNWLGRTPVLPEARLADNSALIDVPVEPFDAFTSNLCAGRVDVGVDQGDVSLETDPRRLRVRIHNLGNQAAYNLAVIVTAGHASGMAYTPALPPCGGTAEVIVALDEPLEPGEPFLVQVNPRDWPFGLDEDDFENNSVSTAVGKTAAGTPTPQAATVTDYDFALEAADVDLSQPGILVLTVHNLGTRDAADVPILIEGKAGRKIIDAIPLVDGGGLGIVAVQLGSLWVPGGTVTVTLNPSGAKGAFPEAARENNVLVVALPKE